MKRRSKGIIAFVLALCLLVSSIVIVHADVETIPNFSMSVSSTSVNVGDTVTVVVSIRDTFISTVEGGVYFDTTMFECTGVEAVDDEEDGDLYITYINSKGKERTCVGTYNKPGQINKAGATGMAFIPNNGDSFEIVGGVVATYTFTALKAGKSDFYFNESGAVANKIDAETGEVVADYKTQYAANMFVGESARVSMTVTESNPTVDVDSVTIKGTEVTTTENKKSVTHTCADPSTITLSAEVLPTTATDPTVTWTSSNENVATVVNGLVTKVGIGSAVITAAAGDKSDTCTVTFSGHNLVKQPGTAATCEAAGTKDYWKCSVCDAEFMDKDGVTAKTDTTDMTIAKLGHDWNEPEWTWAKDYSSATAKFTCKNDTAHEHDVELTDQEITTSGQEATCTQAGAIVYTASVTFNNKEYTNSTETVSTPKLAHTPNPNGHVAAVAASCTEDGNTEYWTCTTCDNYFSKPTCSDDSLISDKNSVIVKAAGHKGVKKDAKAATCVAAGNIDYYECSVCHKYFTDKACANEITDKNSVVRPIDLVNGHKWGEWFEVTAASEDAAGLKKHVCEYNSNHYEELPIPQLNHTHTLELQPATNATCETPGNIAYWKCTKASCGMCFSTGTPASDDEAITEESTVLPATGHDFEAEWTWNDDGTEVFVTFTCKNNNTHVIANQDASASISAITSKSQNSTCTVAGYDTYKASYTLSAIQTKNVEKTFDSTEKKVDRPLAAHKNGGTTVFKDSTCTEEGNQAYTTCSVCQQRFSNPDMMGNPLTDADIIIPKKAHAIGNQIPVVPASCEATGTKAHYHCSTCEKNFEDSACTTEITDLTIPATKHDFRDAWEWNWAEGATEPTAKCTLICQNQDCTKTVELTGTSNPKVTVTKDETASTDPTCLANGSYTFNATVTYSSDYAAQKTYTSSQDYTINKHAHTDNGSKTDAKAASCLEAGNYEYWTCSECGNYFSSSSLSDTSMYANKSDVIIPKEDHSMTETPAKAASCEEEGNIHYWTCSKCHFKYKDAQGNTKVGDTESVTIPATGHDYEAQWHWNFSDENKQYSATATLTCKNNSDHVVDITADKIALNIDEEQSVVPRCTSAGKLVVNGSFTYPEGGKNYTDTGIHDLAIENHTVTKVDAKTATCEEDGNIEHWKCSVCEKLFTDDTCATELTTAQVTIEKLGHDWDEGVITKKPTLTEKGEKTLTCKNNPEHKTTVPVPAINETVYSGTGATWVKGSGESAVVISEADFSKFDDSEYVGVYVDEELVEKTNYNAMSGSTKVAFKADYLETLKLGEHKVMIVSNDGVCNVTLTVENKIEVVDGNGATYNQGSDDGLEIKVNAPVDTIKIGDTVLTDADFTVSEDGNTITINKEVLDKLDPSKEYKVEVTAKNGTKVETTIKVAPKTDNQPGGNNSNNNNPDGKSPKTGDKGITLAIIALLASAAVITVVKKKKSSVN